MVLTSISLKNIRRHVDISLKFGEKLNYIIGGNGLGKTTILESIYYLCTTKSCNSKTDSEVVRFGEDSFQIAGSFCDLTADNVMVNYSLIENKKHYLLNDKTIHGISNVIGNFPVVLLAPADHSVTQGAPGDRRKFMDSVISQANKTYLEILLEYKRTLRQRSSLLLRMKEMPLENGEEELEAWTQKLVMNGVELIKHRINFLETFNKYLCKSYSHIMDSEEVPEIKYHYLDGYTADDISEQFHMMIEERIQDEKRRAANLVGPHRDDFIFKLSDLSLKTFGSQGQHKTFQIALRFAEFFYLKDSTGKTPIFLLDDVFGELDSNRAGRISEYLGEVGQAFVTLTDFGNFSFLKTGEADKVIRLEKNEIVYV